MPLAGASLLLPGPEATPVTGTQGPYGRTVEKRPVPALSGVTHGQREAEALAAERNCRSVLDHDA